LRRNPTKYQYLEGYGFKGEKESWASYIVDLPCIMYNVTISEGENNNDKILFSKLFTTAGQSLPLELISAEGNETISYGPDFSSTGAYHVQSDFKNSSTYPISVEIISINSKPVESPIKVLFDFRTA
jgi:hypothetical protein